MVHFNHYIHKQSTKYQAMYIAIDLMSILINVSVLESNNYPAFKSLIYMIKPIKLEIKQYTLYVATYMYS